MIRLLPQPLVPVQQPGHDHHHRAFRDAAVADRLVAQCLAAEKRHRRIEPDRLLENGAGEEELRHVIEARQATGEHPIELGVQPGFGFRRL